MALPTEKELEILQLFRDKVIDLIPEEQSQDDMFLIRWLRARNLDIEKAHEMLKNAIKWRKENKVDELIIGKSVSPYFYKTFPYWLDGTDKEGRPVFSVPFGKWDIRKVLNDGKSEELVRYLTEGFEHVCMTIRRNSKLYPPKPGCAPVTQMIGIYDWDGVAWGQLFHIQAVQNFLRIGQIYQNFYPEILFTFYFINCPSLISTVLALLKPILDPRTLGKITCFGTDKKVWKAELLKHIDANQLRPQFGGTKTD